MEKVNEKVNFVSADTTKKTQVVKRKIQLNPFWALYGFILWVGGVIVFRLVGQNLFDPKNPALLVALFVGHFPFMAALTYPIRRNTSYSERPAAIASAFVPVMLGDAVGLAFFSQFYPNMTSEQVIYMISWTVLGYGIGFATAFVPVSE